MPSVSSHWKTPVPLPAIPCRQALGQIERNDDADEPAADALQQASEKQRPVAVREGDHRNAEDKATPLRIISGLRPIASAITPAKSVEMTLPSRTAATMTESCAGVSLEVASR